MVKQNTRVKEKSVDLDDIKLLGGEKSDLDLIGGVDEDEEVEDLEEFEEDFNADPVKKDDVRDFINQLGIKKYRELQDDNTGDEDVESKNKKKEEKQKALEEKTNVEKKEKKTNGEKKEKKLNGEKKDKFAKKKKDKVQHNEVSSTTFDISAHIKNYKPRQYLLIKAGQSWLDIQVPNASRKGDHSHELEQQMENFASKLLQDEVAVYNKQRESSKKSEVGWIKTVLSSGTLGDKVAALTLLVQESPIQNLSSLETLINMAKKKGKRECMMAADTIKELFSSYLLPSDRKLCSFDQHPLSSVGELSGGNKDTVDRYLLVWLFESKLKEKFASFIKAIEMMSHDTLLATKQKALGIIFDLLVNKPEQEKTLLNMLVNKVGDPNYKLASKTAYLLRRLVDKHPNMKSVVVDEVERLLYRPNISIKAQYYSICFLNQLMLTREDELLAAKLITLYFSFFKTFVKKGEVESKMMSALLTGVNRAYPYAKVDEEYLAEQLNTIYKLVHVVNFNTSLQALMLIYQVMDSSETVSDRYYVALYRKMSDPSLKTSSKQAMFLNLLFKSIKKDTVERRIKALIKRLLQVCSSQPPQFVCGALVLLGELVKVKPSVIVSRQASEDSDDEEHFVDVHDPDSDDERKDLPQKVDQKSSWVHKTNVKGGSGHYDPHHRNPMYCNADKECIWELKMLANHFHPTVSLYASRLVKGEAITYSGNPLEDFTTIRFLDRFVYKNPKKKESLPESRVSKQKKLLPTGIKSIPVNSEKYLENSEEQIPVEELFYYRYFTQKAARSKKEEDEEASDAGSVGDDEFDAYLEGFEKNLESEYMGDDDLDFAREVNKRMKKKKGDNLESESEEDGNDLSDEDGNDLSEEDGNDLSDEEVDFEGDEDFANAFKDFDEDMIDEENVTFSDDNDDFPSVKVNKKRKTELDDLPLGNKKKKGASSSLFAAADEFSHLMEDNSDIKGGLMIGSDAVSNQDNSHVKQLKWEAERDRKLKMKHNRKFKKFHKKRK